MPAWVRWFGCFDWMPFLMPITLLSVLCVFDTTNIGAFYTSPSWTQSPPPPTLGLFNGWISLCCKHLGRSLVWRYLLPTSLQALWKGHGYCLSLLTQRILKIFFLHHPSLTSHVISFQLLPFSLYHFLFHLSFSFSFLFIIIYFCSLLSLSPSLPPPSLILTLNSFTLSLCHNCPTVFTALHLWHQILLTPNCSAPLLVLSLILLLLMQPVTCEWIGTGNWRWWQWGWGGYNTRSVFFVFWGHQQ